MLKLAVLAMGLSCASSSGGEFYEDDLGVLLLDNTNFDLAIEAHDLLLVKFYAPWCAHCKNFAPVYSEIATRLREEQKDAPAGQARIRLGKLDGTEAVSIAERFEVKGYPKIKLFRNGRPENYAGKRTADDILSFLQKYRRAATKQLKTVEEAVEFASHSDAALLGFFDNLEGPEWENFQKAGKVHDEVRFAVATEKSIFAHYKVDVTPTAMLFNTFGEGKVALTGKPIGDPRRLNRFVVANSMPTVIDFSVKDSRKFLGPGRVKFFGVQVRIKIYCSLAFSPTPRLTRNATSHSQRHLSPILKLMMFLDPSSSDFKAKRRILDFVANKNKELMIHVLINPKHSKVSFRQSSVADRATHRSIMTCASLYATICIPYF
jgi:protein disulfide-isomerase A1